MVEEDEEAGMPATYQGVQPGVAQPHVPQLVSQNEAQLIFVHHVEQEEYKPPPLGSTARMCRHSACG
jgi:hypothetical protein